MAVSAHKRAVEAALGRILASPTFDSAERQSRFLRFIVERTLSGESGSIKEYVVGLEVFDRPASFDPQVDSIVRVEAKKLRASLERYYQTEGRSDSMRISMPKGGYVPVFEGTAPESKQRTRRAAITAAAILAVAALATVAWMRYRASARVPPVQITRLAVLPFLNLSGDNNDEYFCDGLTEQLIDLVSHVGGLEVVARTSVFQFKGKAQDIRQIGRALNVNAVLEGSVRKDGTHLRVTAQLNDVEKGFHLWSQTYDRQVQDVIDVQENIARAIAITLRHQVASADEARMTLRYPHNDAYDSYLRGLYAYDRSTEDGLQKSLAFFEKAIDADPRFAPSVYALAASYVALSIYGMWSPERSIPKARQAAQQALELDKNMAEPHAVLGYIAAVYDWNWPEARREFLKAIELNPACAHCRAWYAFYYLAPMQRFPEARDEVEKALSLDPFSGFFQAFRIAVPYFTRQYDLAIEEGTRAAQMNDDNFLVHLFLGTAYRQKGLLEPALAEEKKVALLTGSGPLALRNLGDVYAAMGNREETSRILESLAERAKSAYVNPSTFAMIYGALGDQDQAMKWLERAANEHDPALVFLRSASLFDRYHDKPRFAAVFRRIGLPEY